MDKNANILITGGNGFLGTSLVENLRTRGYWNLKTFSSSEFNLINKNDTEKLFAFYNPDVVIHLAAKVGGIGANQKNPGKFCYENLAMGMNVIETARQHNIKKLIIASTICAYPKFTPVPFKEDNLWNGFQEQVEIRPCIFTGDGPYNNWPEATNAPYGMAKRMLLVLAQAYRQQYGLNTVVLFPVNLYGECFSSDTEVMTVSGIKLVKDIKIGDKVYSLNPDTHKVEITKVIATQHRTTNEFINFRTKGTNFRVTPDHNIYYRTNTTFVKRPAEYFRNKAGKGGQICFAVSKGLTSNNEKYPEYISLEKYLDTNHIKEENMVRDFHHSSSKKIPICFTPADFCEFLGWYISEGSWGFVRNSKGGKQSTPNYPLGQIRISQSKKVNPAYHVKIGDLLNRMGIPHGQDEHAYFFASRMFSTFIKREVGLGSYEKRIPRFIFEEDFPNSLRQILFNSLMMGDGHKDGSAYTTSSLGLVSDFMELCLLLGKNICAPRTISNKTSNHCWRIYFKTKPKGIKKKQIFIEKLSSPEDVFCFTTEKNHIIYA